MHGLGVYTWKIGDKYIGEVNYGRIHGFGTYTWRTNSKCAAAAAAAAAAAGAQAEPLAPRSPFAPRRRRYVGQWKDGKMHGHGVKTDPQGNIFEGDWKDGKPVLGGKQKGLMDMLPWFNEEPGGVAPGTRRHGEYSNVATHDPDDM